MKSHYKTWCDSATKTSMLAAFLQQTEDTDYFPEDGIMDRGDTF